MKFWQLISIFRDEKNILENELKKEEWQVYFNHYRHLESIVKYQERDILDMKIDEHLLRNICMISKKKIYSSPDKHTIYSYMNANVSKEISILEAIYLFNHDLIEEVFEKTSSSIHQ